MKNFSIFTVSICLLGTIAQARQLTTVKVSEVPNANVICVAGSNGECLMNGYDAKSYCPSIGKHLPTARELAKVASSYGAAGIREAKYNDPYITTGGSMVYPANMGTELMANRNQGYEAVHDNYESGIGYVPGHINFYFSSAGFKAPSNELVRGCHAWFCKTNYFWTSEQDGLGVTFSDYDGPNDHEFKQRLIHFGKFDRATDKLPVVCLK